jgi:hypothetical protein
MKAAGSSETEAAGSYKTFVPLSYPTLLSHPKHFHKFQVFKNEGGPE